MAETGDILDIIETGLILSLIDCGYDRAEIEPVIKDYLTTIRESYGGAHYVKRHPYQCAPAEIEEIKKEFNGRNRAQIQEKFNISRATLYRYLRK